MPATRTPRYCPGFIEFESRVGRQQVPRPRRWGAPAETVNLGPRRRGTGDESKVCLPILLGSLVSARTPRQPPSFGRHASPEGLDPLTCPCVLLSHALSQCSGCVGAEAAAATGAALVQTMAASSFSRACGAPDFSRACGALLDARAADDVC